MLAAEQAAGASVGKRGSSPGARRPGAPSTLAVPLSAGLQPGLRFAAQLDGQGGCLDLNWQGVNVWQPEAGFLWVHLERDTPEAERWVREQSGVQPMIAEALLADDSRPRIELVDDGLLLVLRGVNLAATEVELVPIHVWIVNNRAITLRDRAHSLNALRDIRLDLVAGHGPHTAGMLLVQICDKIVRDLEPVLAQMDDAVAQLEEELIASAPSTLRHQLADLRRRAIHLRRYLLPQREALYRLQSASASILNADHRMQLASVIDKVIRFIEDLDAIRDRTTVLHEDLSALIGEQIAKISNRLTGVAALLLTPSLVVGMLGANVGGIPGEGNAWAFTELAGVIVALLAVQWVIFRRLRWL